MQTERISQSERVTFLATPALKATLAARAAAGGVSIGEYIRRKVEEDEQLTAEQEAELSSLVAEVDGAVPRINAALEQMTRDLAALHEENTRFFAERDIR